MKIWDWGTQMEEFTPRLPRRFAVAGGLVGLFLFAMSWCIDIFNPFHRPPGGVAISPGSPSVPHS
jgi:hypothetical protein